MNTLEALSNEIERVKHDILSVKTKEEEEALEGRLFDLMAEYDSLHITPEEKGIILAVELAELMGDISRAIYMKHTLSEDTKQKFDAVRPILLKMWNIETDNIETDNV